MAQPAGTSGVASEATSTEGELKPRASCMQMIAIGGAIGTDLFVASGKGISTRRPRRRNLAYALIIMVLFLMQSLGRWLLTCPSRRIPDLRGTLRVSSFWIRHGLELLVQLGDYRRRELSSRRRGDECWFPSVPSWVWAAGFLTMLLTGISALSAHALVSEFWLATIRDHHRGHLPHRGIAASSASWAVAHGRLPAGDCWWKRLRRRRTRRTFAIFMVAGFCSLQSTEMIGVAAGVENPTCPALTSDVLAHRCSSISVRWTSLTPQFAHRPEPAHCSGRQHQHLPFTSFPNVRVLLLRRPS